MINILLTTALGVTILGGLSFFLVWFGEYSKKQNAKKYNAKFQYFDKYVTEMDTASERQMEKRRQERKALFDSDRQGSDHSTRMARLSGEEVI